MNEIKKLNFKNRTSLKEKPTKPNLKLAEIFDSAKSAAETSNLEKVKSHLARGTAKTHSSCWQVRIRLEYGRRIQTIRSSRWFGGRKRIYSAERHSSRKKTKSSAMAATKRSSRLGASVLSSSPRSQTRSLQPATANSGFLPNIGVCSACGKTGY